MSRKNNSKTKGIRNTLSNMGYSPPSKPFKIYAMNINFLMQMENIMYPTDFNFVKDSYVQKVIENGYVPEYIAENTFFQDVGVEFSPENYLIKGYVPKPSIAFHDDKSEERKRLDEEIRAEKFIDANLPEKRTLHGEFWWPYRLKKITNPEVLAERKLKFVYGCGCGRNIEPDSFSLISTNGEANIMQTFKFFENSIDRIQQPAMSRWLDEMESANKSE